MTIKGTIMASNSNEPKDLLTVEELVAMPESEYMNDAQLAFFRNRLQELESEILANAGATTENLRETQLAPDPEIGRASCREREKIAAGERRVEKKRLV